MARAFAPLRMALPNDQLVKELRRHPAAASGCVEVFRGWMAQGLRRTSLDATRTGALLHNFSETVENNLR
jgi:hypothetical protein